MNNNAELQTDVQDAIKWEPLMHAAEIGVTVKDGVVTLTGTVDSYGKKLEAEKAAKNVVGVKAVVEQIKVKFPNSWSKTDNDIATEVLSALKLNWLVPDEKLKVKIEDGWVTLDGQLHYNYQREAAKDAVRFQMGVKGVTDNIVIQSETHDAIEKANIEGALKRNWNINDNDIKVQATGHKVTLTGTVNSWFQKDEASRMAWGAPGVWNVDNELAVEYAQKAMKTAK